MRISVIIPVRNEALKIRACIEGILKQSIEVLEIIVIDSGSNDGTLEILREYEKVRVIEIPGGEFNHGQTRNLGAENARGDYLLFTVGDAEGADSDWIRKMTEGFVNEEIVAVCGKQIVPHHRDKNPVEWFRPVTKPEIKTYKFTKQDFENLSPKEKRKICGWDDVTALYRADALRTIPFRKTMFAEDAQWAKDALLHGYSIAYNPAARVYHYHKADPEYAYRRTFTVIYHFYHTFGLRPEIRRNTIRSELSLIKRLIRSRGLNVGEMIYWWNYNKKLRKGINKAIIKFNTLIDEGVNALESYYFEEFSSPPIPSK